jgi:hypothetical protein
VILEDRDAARVPVFPEVVQDDRRRDPGVGVEHRRDGVLVLVELGAGCLSGVPRWFRELEQPDHRGAADAEPPGDRRLAQVLPFTEAMDLCPVVHAVHPFLLPSPMDGRVVENWLRCGRCPVFGRREVSILQAASTGVQVLAQLVMGCGGHLADRCRDVRTVLGALRGSQTRFGNGGRVRGSRKPL